MLKLRNVCKNYKYGKKYKKILDNINLDFKNKEMVFILGASGSGKTTLLNIMGGLLKGDSGKIILDLEDITKLSRKKMNDYRNSMIGYVFQDYNLIDYMNVYDNIMIGCTLKNRIEYVDGLLKELDIYDKKNVVVKKLSGGEKQRVAIIRSLVNDPDIILCDEPTGALDSANGIKIMEILKKISHEKLVVVVTHDANLAYKYGDRIINIEDGKVEYEEIKEIDKFKEIKTRKIKKKRIIKLAIKNLWLKKLRTLITSLAITLGISSILIVLNLANNFNGEIKTLEEEVVSVFPVNINNLEYEKDAKNKSSKDKIILKEDNKIKNNITLDYVDYLESIQNISYMTVNYDINFPIISDKYKYIDNMDMELIPDDNYIRDSYYLLDGKYSTSANEIMLVIDYNNNVSKRILNYFEIDSDIQYKDIIGRKIKVINNDIYFNNISNYFVINDNIKDMYNRSNMELTIVGVIKEKESVLDKSFIYYSKDIINSIIDINKNSEVVKKQLEVSYNVLGNNLKKEELLKYLGYNSMPSNINIYFNNILDKEETLKLLDEYNKCHEYIKYTDTMKDMTDVILDFVSIVSIILISFSIVTVIVSLIMIIILTGIRVLERKKEIGILKSLGFSKKNILSLFNIENIIIGITSSLFSLSILWIMKDPVNKLLYEMLGLDEILQIDYLITVLVLILNIIIIKMCGSITARKANKLDVCSCIYDR